MYAANYLALAAVCAQNGQHGLAHFYLALAKKG